MKNKKNHRNLAWQTLGILCQVPPSFLLVKMKLPPKKEAFCYLLLHFLRRQKAQSQFSSQQTTARRKIFQPLNPSISWKVVSGMALSFPCTLEQNRIEQNRIEQNRIEQKRIESNHQGWKRPTGSSSPTIHPSPTVLIKPCPHRCMRLRTHDPDQLAWGDGSSEPITVTLGYFSNFLL